MIHIESKTVLVVDRGSGRTGECLKELINRMGESKDDMKKIEVWDGNGEMIAIPLLLYCNHCNQMFEPNIDDKNKFR